MHGEDAGAVRGWFGKNLNTKAARNRGLFLFFLGWELGEEGEGKSRVIKEVERIH